MSFNNSTKLVLTVFLILQFCLILATNYYVLSLGQCVNTGIMCKLNNVFIFSIISAFFSTFLTYIFAGIAIKKRCFIRATLSSLVLPIAIALGLYVAREVVSFSLLTPSG